MSADQLYTFILIYTIALATILLVNAIVNASFLRWIHVALAALITAVCFWMVGLTKSLDPVSHLIGSIYVARDPRHILGLLFAASISIGVASAPFLLPSKLSDDRWRQGCAAGLVLFSWVGVSFCIWTVIWRENDILRFRAKLHDSQFVIEDVCDFVDYPFRVVCDEEGRVFVNYDKYDNGFERGGIALIEYEDDKPTITEVAASPLLFATFGMAVRDGDIYVARTGIHRRAIKGRTQYEATGAVTKLSDLDQDGQYEYYDDVIDGLPGQGLPDSQHQNNGLAFDATGNLYITNGSPFDRQIGAYPWEGTILRSSPDFKKVEVFADGFRNPYALAFNRDGALFVVDNDTTDNTGDEFNYVRQGAFYGHPFVTSEDVDESGETVQPVFSSGKNGHFAGMTYSDCDQLAEQYRDSFWITDTFTHQLFWAKLKREGDDYTLADLQVFADLPGCVDVAVSPQGWIFVLDRYNRRLYRIRQKDVADSP